MTIGINWAEVWKPVWKAVWRQDVQQAQPEQNSGGYWVDYGTRRRKREPALTYEEIAARLAESRERLEARKQIRLTQAKSQELTQKLREAFGEQDSLQSTLEAMDEVKSMKEQIRLDDAEIMEFLPMILSVH
jgi:hypothetical protein